MAAYSATYTHQQEPTNICNHITTELITHTDVPESAVLTSVTLASTDNALPDDGVTAPKHFGAILM